MTHTKIDVFLLEISIEYIKSIIKTLICSIYSIY